MANTVKDEQDRKLDAVFRLPPLSDAGFSARVVCKVRRRIWVRRLAIPLAACIGGLLSFEQLTGLVAALSRFSSLISQDIIGLTIPSVVQWPTAVVGAILILACLLGVELLEE